MLQNEEKRVQQDKQVFQLTTKATQLSMRRGSFTPNNLLPPVPHEISCSPIRRSGPNYLKIIWRKRSLTVNGITMESSTFGFIEPKLTKK